MRDGPSAMGHESNEMRGLRGMVLLLAALGVLTAAWTGWTGWRAGLFGGRGAGAGTAGAGRGAAVPFAGLTVAPGSWGVFRAEAAKAKQAAAGDAEREFRLAGTFLVLRRVGETPHEQCAIFDAAAKGPDGKARQVLATAGEELRPGLRVKRVERDLAVLEEADGDGPAREFTLRLGPAKAAGGADAAPAEGAADAAAVAAAAGTALETNRFGSRIAEWRWEFSRDAVMDYYREMMESPERVSELFVAMTPDRDERGKIAGYRLNPGGEDAFYRDVGLLPGDVVRRVNSFNMTSRKRAEYFIGEFVQGRLGTVVLDIEREGQPEKLIYFIR